MIRLVTKISICVSHFSIDLGVEGVFRFTSDENSEE